MVMKDRRLRYTLWSLVLAVLLSSCIGDIDMQPDAGLDAEVGKPDSGPGEDASTDPDTGGSCQGVVCYSPPGPCFQPTGVCVEGRCQYAFADGVACDDADPCTGDDACWMGSCVGSPIACDQPPASFCDGDDDLVFFEAPGVCRDGICE
jgi:hypothetical protein